MTCPLEEAEAYQRLLAEFGWTQDELARRIGKDRSSIANASAAAPAEVIQEDLRAGRLSMGHARALLGLDCGRPAAAPGADPGPGLVGAGDRGRRPGEPARPAAASAARGRDRGLEEQPGCPGDAGARRRHPHPRARELPFGSAEELEQIHAVLTPRRPAVSYNYVL
jgi:ParB family chromosome partitioning protein